MHPRTPALPLARTVTRSDPSDMAKAALVLRHGAFALVPPQCPEVTDGQVFESGVCVTWPPWVLATKSGIEHKIGIRALLMRKAAGAHAQSSQHQSSPWPHL